MYLTHSIIADDPYMRLRVASCAAQEGVTAVGIDPDEWTRQWRRVWASSPNWDSKWESAILNDVEEPGKNPGVISDGDILATVQAMKPFHTVESNTPELNPLKQASRQFVHQAIDPLSRTVFALKEALEEVRGDYIMIPPPPDDQ